MRTLTAALKLVDGVRISNVWLFEDGAGRFLVDTGHPVERAMLQRELWRAGVRGKGDLTAVLLTHRHSDHAGNAAWLRKTFDAPVFCHAADRGILEGHAHRSKLARGRARLHEEVLCRVEDAFPAVSWVDDVYAAGAWRWGLRVLEVPGHTEGSVMLLHEASGTLFSGDAILAGYGPVRFLEALNLAFPGFSLDAETCHARVRAHFAELPPVATLAAGHGPPVTKDAHAKLQRLLAR